MSLAGLILTDDDGQSERGTPRALLTVAGQPLIEYQVRIVRAAGAGHIVVLVDQLPTALVEAFDRLRADGIPLDVARTARDAADRIHPDERVVMMTAGAIAPAETLAAHAKSADALVLSVPASEQSQHLERIDGEHRWTGVALIPGSTLRATADMLGDWALGPTVLRTALQHGARSKVAEDVRLVRDETEAREASLSLIAGGQEVGGIGKRQIVAPLAGLAMPWLIARRVPFEPLVVLPLVLLGVSAVAALLVVPAASAIALVLASFAAEAARRIASAGGRSTNLLGWHARLQPAAFLLVAGSTGWLLFAAGAGWGPVVLALWAAIALYLQPSNTPLRGWMADAESGALILLAALAVGQPLIGLMLIVFHAVVTQFALVRRAR